jgi:hypothetical protein
VIDSLSDGLQESLEVIRGADGGTRKVLVSSVFLCMCCVASPALLFIDVFPVMLLSLGDATRVTTCVYFPCMLVLDATLLDIALLYRAYVTLVCHSSVPFTLMTLSIITGTGHLFLLIGAVGV